MLERRTLFETDRLSVVAEMHADEDGQPDVDWSDEENAAYQESWQSGDFEFVGMVAKVMLRGADIGRDSLWRVEHGTVCGVDADAWDFTPARVEGNTVIMGSPLAGVVSEALARADEWLSGVEAGDRTDSRWFPISSFRRALSLAAAWSEGKRTVTIEAPSVMYVTAVVGDDGSVTLVDTVAHTAREDGSDFRVGESTGSPEDEERAMRFVLENDWPLPRLEG